MGFWGQIWVSLDLLVQFDAWKKFSQKKKSPCNGGLINGDESRFVQSAKNHQRKKNKQTNKQTKRRSSPKNGSKFDVKR